MYDFFSFDHWDKLWRLTIAQIIVLMLFVMNVMTLSIPMMDLIRPTFFLMGLFYWAIYRPSLLSVIWIFVLGVIYDALLGFPIGLHSILLIVIQYAVRAQRLFFMGQSFLTIWLGFTLAAALFLVGEWIVFSMLLVEWMSWKEPVLSWVVSAFIFPFISLILFLVHKMLPNMQGHHLIGGGTP